MIPPIQTPRTIVISCKVIHALQGMQSSTHQSSNIHASRCTVDMLAYHVPLYVPQYPCVCTAVGRQLRIASRSTRHEAHVARPQWPTCNAVAAEQRRAADCHKQPRHIVCGCVCCLYYICERAGAAPSIYKIVATLRSLNTAPDNPPRPVPSVVQPPPNRGAR